MIFIHFILLLGNCETKSYSRVLGAREAHKDEFPYVLRLEVQIALKRTRNEELLNAHICTASAITPIWTLTAGHCIKSIVTNTLPNIDNHFYERLKAVVRYGSIADNHSFSDVLNTIVHPSYKYIKTSDASWLQNDIGLVENTPIKLKEYGKLSPVDYTSLLGTKATMSGFGRMILGDVIATTLFLKKPLQVLDIVLKRCEKSIWIYPALCVARPCNVPKAPTLCPGDSGGPLIHVTGIIGINSAAELDYCHLKYKNHTGIVGIMTASAPHIDWIVERIKVNN